MFPGEDDFLGLLEDEGVPADSAELVADPAEVVRQQCAVWVESASSLRHGAPWPSANAPPVQVRDALVDVRSRLDQLELVYARAMALKAATAAQARAAEQAADDAWDDRANADRRAIRREYEGSRERYAYWELDIRPLRLRAREARERADFARATCDRIELAYRGLDGLRRDLAGRLTHLRWETSMEQ